MIAAIRAVVFTVSLVVPSFASAECAWVLWRELHTMGPSTWTRALATNSREDCLKSGREHAQYTRNLAPDKQKVSDPLQASVYDVLDGRPLGVAHYQCWPDTVDPREPKGGGR